MDELLQEHKIDLTNLLPIISLGQVIEHTPYTKPNLRQSSSREIQK